MDKLQEQLKKEERKAMSKSSSFSFSGFDHNDRPTLFLKFTQHSITCKMGTPSSLATCKKGTQYILTYQDVETTASFVTHAKTTVVRH